MWIQDRLDNPRAALVYCYMNDVEVPRRVGGGIDIDFAIEVYNESTPIFGGIHV